MSNRVKVRFSVNGKNEAFWVHPMARLLDVLREEADLTGTKEGCGEGECGACSVLMDGKLVNSCLVPVLQAQGKTVQTVEGLKGRHPIQRAFVEAGGAQCGICTPGMVMACVALVKHRRNGKRLRDEEIREGLAGNLCRCTGFEQIIESVKLTSERG